MRSRAKFGKKLVFRKQSPSNWLSRRWRRLPRRRRRAMTPISLNGRTGSFWVCPRRDNS
jgi:hypothetical protein